MKQKKKKLRKKKSELSKEKENANISISLPYFMVREENYYPSYEPASTAAL